MKNNGAAGFNGNGLWAVIVGLGVLVAWLRSDFGPQTALYAVAGLFGVLCVFGGIFAALGIKKVTLDGLIGMKAAESKIKVEETKALRQDVNNEQRLMQMVMRLSMAIGQQVGSAYKAQVEAEQRTATPAANPYVVDLGSIQHQNADEL